MGAFLGLLSLAGLLFGFFALIRGHLDWARLRSRRHALAFIGGSVIVFFIAVALTPTDPSRNPASGSSTIESSAGESTLIRALRPTPTPNYGQDRLTPLSMGQSIVARNSIELQVLSFERNAMGKIRQMDTFASEPKPGEEAVLALLRATCRKTTTETCQPSPSEFRIVGERGVIYTTSLFESLKPNFSQEIFGGVSLDGYVSFRVSAGEGGLVLIYSAPLRGSIYLALE